MAKTTLLKQAFATGVQAATEQIPVDYHALVDREVERMQQYHYPANRDIARMNAAQNHAVSLLDAQFPGMLRHIGFQHHWQVPEAWKNANAVKDE